MRYTSSYAVLIIISSIMFVLNIVLYSYLLGISHLLYEPITLAWLQIGITIVSSAILYAQAYKTMQLFKTEIRSQHFFFVAAVCIASSLPALNLFIRRFTISLLDDVLIFLARTFSFLYILSILSIVASFSLANLAYKNNTLVFTVLACFSALLAKVGIISFSKAVSVDDVFIGGSLLLGGISFAVCIISLAIYTIELFRLQIRKRLIVSQIIYLLCFILALHIVLLFPEYFILLIVTSGIMIISLLGYLRGIFVHSF